MTSQKRSASTPSFASTVLPSAEVIKFRPVKRIAHQARGFTKVSISKMHCSKGEQEALFWDPSCRGFGMRALKSGRRTWIYQYRDEHKRTRRIALGDVSAVGLDAARQAARQHAASVTQGANPSVERKGKKNAPSVLKVIESYLPHAKTRQRARSYQETERQLLKHAAPLHHDRAETVRRSDIATLLDGVSKNSGRFAANRLRAALSALWSWGMRAGHIQSDTNPVTFTLRHPERARDRTLSDNELRAIWTATSGDGDYARIVRLCILTGCRREEVGGFALG
jgi:integrase